MVHAIDSAVAPHDGDRCRCGADEREVRTQQLLELAYATDDESVAAQLRSTAIEVNYTFACHIAHRYAQRGIDIEDLQQVTLLALVLAVQRFCPNSGNSFTAYAVPTIAGEIKRHFRDHGWMVRPPRRLHETYRDIQQTRAELEQLGGQIPSPTDLADLLGIAPETVHEALGIEGCFAPASLDAPLRDRPNTTVADDALLATPDGTDRLVWTIAIHQLVRNLPPRDRAVLRLRFEAGLTQREIGERLGISQMQVSRLLNASLTSLRSTLTRQLDDVAC